MALSIKTEEADRLARELARLRGETITEAVTVALREQCARERAAPADREARFRALQEFLDRTSGEYDRRPVTKEEWDETSGDTD
ncbi:MAG: type II toxin-antitoxin system VapB family antitoxin [Caulobacterales bacterium]